MALQHLRSSTAHKRPIPSVMSAGQIAINTNEASPGLFFKDSNGDLVKVGPVHIGTTAPNSSPDSVAATALVTGTVYQILTVGTSDFTLVGASANTVGVVFTATGTTTGTGTVSGQQGVEKGEQWLDTTGGTYVLKIYDGTAWRSESGTFVDSAGDTMTGALLLDNAASASAPDLSFDGDADTGVYSPGADQLAISTNGTAAVTVDSSQRVGIGTTSPANLLQLNKTDSGSVYLHCTNLTTGSTGSDGALIGLSGSEELTLFNRENNDIKFGTNDTERMRIDSSGNVGIGSSDPGSKLTVQDGSNAAGAILVGADYDGTGLTNNSTKLAPIHMPHYTNAEEKIRLIAGYSDASQSIVSIGGGTASANAATKVQIFTAANTTTTGGTAAITVDSAQRVGIGTTSPTGTIGAGYNSLLTVNSSANTAIDIKDVNGNWFIGTTSGSLVAYSQTATTERARIDSSGRLLVGTTSSLDTPSYYKIQATAPDAAFLILARDDSTTISNNLLGAIRFGDNGGGGNYGFGAQIDAAADATHTSSSKPSRLVFSTTADGASSPTERMRIDNAGRVGINATSLTQQFVVSHSGRDGIAIADTNGSSTQTNLLFSNTRAAGTSNYYVLGYANAVNTFIVYSNGNVLNANNSYTGISDVKLKENIVNASSQWDDIKGLQVRKYNFKEGQTHTQIGLVAQEVELVSPGLVSESPDRDEDGNDLGTTTKSVNYSVLYMKAVKALQEAMERIETLEAKVSALEAN